MSTATVQPPESCFTETTEPRLSCDPPISLTSADLAVANQCDRLGKFHSLREFGYAFVNSYCNQFHCEQVGMGMVRRSHIQVIAISGLAQFKSGSPGVVEMRQSMEECADQDESIVFPAESGNTDFAIHRQWSCHSGGCNVCSVPLRVGDDLMAVISLRRSPSSPFTPELLEQLFKSVAPFGTLISLIDRANQPISRRIICSANEWINRRRSPFRIFCIVGLVLVLSWFFFGTRTYRPLCDCAVVAAELRHMTAPFDARLEKVHVRAGDEVNAGDLLVEFETRPMRIELDTIRAEAARTDVNLRAAMQSGDVSAAALQQAHIRVLLARQAALRQRIDSARLLAPSAGTVIQSSCDKRVGQVFARGDPVLQFTPNDGWMLDIQVPEHAATYVDSNQVGSFAPAARPSDKFEFRIRQVDGSAVVFDENNVFLARAELHDSPPWMRSGMQGVAQVHTKRMPVWWVFLHKVMGWARLRFWL